jgi:Zn-dependent protease
VAGGRRRAHQRPGDELDALAEKIEVVSPALLLAWLAFGYVLLQSFRYLLGARIYLTCALREVAARPVALEAIDAGEWQLLTLLDSDLQAAGFRHLGFAQITPLITYYGAPLAGSVFVDERLPAYALVRRHLAPEYGRLVELELRTVLASGSQLLTVNTPFSSSFLPPGLHVEAHPGLSVSELVQRHAARVVAALAGGEGALEHAHVESLTESITASFAELRRQFRERGWVVPTADHTLDRFTLRGAFALTRYSRRIVKTPGSAVKRAPPVPSEEDRQLRIEADLCAVLHVADSPETAPGTPWPLLTVIGATAVVSFVAMALLWNPMVAVLVLAAVTFHEAGHALAMRSLGYRDVHIFFVPLLGAMTVGRAATATVRDRLLVLLAGPVPGLWLAVALLAIDHAAGPIYLVQAAALTLLILNALNLLPFTPLDGGRALETLSRPESAWRLAVHVASAIGLFVVADVLNDAVFVALGLLWAAMLPRQFRGYRLHRSVAAAVRDRGDFRGVVRVALDVMTTRPYAGWHAVTRQITARAIARSCADSIATPGDRRWGALAYASAWIPVIAALLLWVR